MSDIVERLRRRAETAEALSDTMQDTTARAWQVEAMAVLMRVSRDQSEAADEIERLTACLQVANANHERFERLWYLEKDKVEALTSPQLHQHGGGVEAMKAAAKEFFDIRTPATISIPQYSPYDAFVGGWTAALAQQTLSVPAWQPIETAPKDGTTIILFCPQGDGTPGSTFRLTSGSWFIPPSYGTISDPEVDGQEPPAWLSWDGGFSEETMMPTHWQPLPAHPIQSDVSCSRAREGGTGE